MKTIASDGRWLGRRPLGCAACELSVLGTDDDVGAQCPRCAAVLEVAETRLVEAEPELVVANQLDEAGVVERLRPWVKALRYRPEDLDAERIASRARLVWLPRWLADVTGKGSWSAELGFAEEVASTREALDKRGRWTTVSETDIRLRWEPRAGTLSRRFDNLPAPALVDDEELLASLGGYASAGRPGGLPEGLVWLPERTPEEARPLAEEGLATPVAELCQRAAGAAARRGFRMRVAWSEHHWTWLLLPVWSSWYEDDEGRRHAVLVGGEAGGVTGVRQASQAAADAAADDSVKWAKRWGLGALLGVPMLLLPPLGIGWIGTCGLIALAMWQQARSRRGAPERWNARFGVPAEGAPPTSSPRAHG